MSFYPIVLDKSRNFKYGMKAISLVEKKFKKPISKVDLDSLTMDETAVLIWAGLEHEDKNLSPDRIMTLVDDYSNVSTVLAAAGEALQGAFGGTEDTEEKN